MPSVSEVRVSSFQELLDALEQNNEGYNGSIWYRGQSNKDWNLVPGYHRIERQYTESTLLTRFKQNAAMLISDIPKNSFDWLFLMQHYGVPTRLLDWTESPLVALYFALTSSEENDYDAVLWSLKPTEFNRNAGIRSPNEDFFIPSFEDIEVENYSVESLSSNSNNALYPIAVIATRNNTRIQAQHGVFTIHHLDTVPIEDIGDSTHVTKYIIPNDNKAKLAKQLEILGFTKFQLFPELSSIGEMIKKDFG